MNPALGFGQEGPFQMNPQRDCTAWLRSPLDDGGEHIERPQRLIVRRGNGGWVVSADAMAGQRGPHNLQCLGCTFHHIVTG